jgi:hypothetical protein
VPTLTPYARAAGDMGFAMGTVVILAVPFT